MVLKVRLRFVFLLQQVRYGEDELLQLAIQQSLMEQDGDQDQVS